MTQTTLNYKPVSQLWVKAGEQAANIPAIKDRKTKRRQIVMLCETLKRAMTGGA